MPLKYSGQAENWTVGVYILHVVTDSGVFVQKVVKQ